LISASAVSSWSRLEHQKTQTNYRPTSRNSARSRLFNPTALAPYQVTPPPAGFGFYGHPDWQPIGRDDTLIPKHGLTTAGFGHATEKVIRGSNHGLPIEAFIHRWKAERTET
jgi:hypothetical protein